jgi:hypothetical protein
MDSPENVSVDWWDWTFDSYFVSLNAHRRQTPPPLLQSKPAFQPGGPFVQVMQVSLS